MGSYWTLPIMQRSLVQADTPMKALNVFSLLLLCVVLLTHCSSSKSTGSGAASDISSSSPKIVSIGGEPVVTITRPAVQDKSKPRFLEAIVLPGRGMNLLQVKAYLPGKGEINLLTSPPLAEAKQILDEQDDEFGNKGFQVGAGILLPYVNRIRGTLSPDGKTIQTDIAGKTIPLPASWHGKNPGAQIVSMHGLILSAKFQDVQAHDGPAESSVSAVLHGGNFGGHWLSETDVHVKTVLKDDALEMNVTATNVGHEPLPMGISFHPWFRLPSGKREQARLHVPADQRALVYNYDDVLPTGKTEAVKGTRYDFTAPEGNELGTLFMDDNFLHVERDKDGSVVTKIIDPAANYGLRIVALSPEVKAVQVYTPPDEDFIVVEPQFNLADPYNKIWGKTDTGMVLLKPGESVSWRVRLELFIPTKGK